MSTPTERIHSEVAQLRKCLELCTEIGIALGPPPTTGMTIIEFHNQMDKLRSEKKRTELANQYRQSPHYTYRNAFILWNIKLQELQTIESIFSVLLNLQEGRPVVVTCTLSDETGLPPLVTRSSLDRAAVEIPDMLHRHVNDHYMYVILAHRELQELWIRTP